MFISWFFSPELPQSPSSEVFSGGEDMSSPNQNSTDEEKLLSTLGRSHRMDMPGPTSAEQGPATFSLDNRLIVKLKYCKSVNMYCKLSFIYDRFISLIFRYNWFKET